MTEDVDYAPILTRAEKHLKRVYPLLTEHKGGEAFLAVLDVQREICNLMTWIVENRTK